VPLSQNVRAIRLERGLTQGQLAARAKVSRVYIVRVETGQQDPTSRVIVRLARALRVKPGQLFE
jgi:transcriptional regulator with XRE-family HTH domain